MPQDQTPVLVILLMEQRKPGNSDRRGRPVVFRGCVKNLDRRSQKFVLEPSKNVHRAIRVNYFPFAEVWVGGINHALRFASGDHGNLIIQSLRAPEISLREVWKNLVLNI